MIPPQLTAIIAAIALTIGSIGAWTVRGWRCEAAASAVTDAAQAETITAATEADAAAAKREQSRLIQQAALAGARKAIAEAPKDACIDAPAPAAVLDSLRPQEHTP